MGDHGGANLRPGPVRLLDLDLDLADAVTDAELAAASRASLVHTVAIEVGRWSDAGRFAGAHLYLIQGALVGRSQVAQHRGTELLGPGRVFSTIGPVTGETTTGVRAEWSALEPSWVAILDRQFWGAMGAFPAVTVAVVERAVRRADDLTRRLAVAGLESLPERIVTLLTVLAQAHGRVARAGTVIDLPISGALLAELLPASRSAVSRAVAELERGGQLSRGPGKRRVLTTTSDAVIRSSDQQPSTLRVAPSVS